MKEKETNEKDLPSDMRGQTEPTRCACMRRTRLSFKVADGKVVSSFCYAEHTDRAEEAEGYTARGNYAGNGLIG